MLDFVIGKPPGRFLIARAISKSRMLKKATGMSEVSAISTQTAKRMEIEYRFAKVENAVESSPHR